jgi:PleD family two-component response regulator
LSAWADQLNRLPATQCRQISSRHDSRKVLGQGKSQNSWEENVETFISRRRPKILIADDHGLIAKAYAKLLQPAYEVAGTVANGHALLQKAASLHPQLVLVDVAMPLLNGLDAGKQIKQKMPDVKIIFVTMITMST